MDDARARAVTPIGVTVVGGFLGAGKTTLVNRLLADAAGRRVAVLVNDFGAINVDSALIEQRNERVIALANGCVCCSLQRDLVAQLGELAATSPAFDHIVIEASGVSDPSEVHRALGYPQLRERVRPLGIVTVLDVSRPEPASPDIRALAEAQWLAADFVILGHADQAAPDELAAVRERCAARGIRAFGPGETDSLWSVLTGDPAGPATTAGRFVPAPPAADRLFETWTTRSDAVYRLASLRAALSSLPADVYRAKGFLKVAEAGGTDCEVQVVGERVDIRRAAALPGSLADTLVFIGRRGALDRAEITRRLQACRTGE